MVDNKKPGGAKGLAAMFEANLSSSNTDKPKPLERRNTKKLVNPFEQAAKE